MNAYLDSLYSVLAFVENHHPVIPEDLVAASLYPTPQEA